MAKANAPASMGDDLQDAAQAITRALTRPEAAGPLQGQLTKLLGVVTQMARGGAPTPPGGGAAPGAGPAGTPAGAGAGPPGAGAANPAMPSLTGGQLPPTPPGAGATSGIPQPDPEQLRQMVAQANG
jgi:hypothetical protein